MKVKVSKWGNCLGIRIPLSHVRELGIQEGDQLLVEQSGGSLVVRKLASEKVTLEQMLSGVTPENRHGEVNWGPDVGREIV